VTPRSSEMTCHEELYRLTNFNLGQMLSLRLEYATKKIFEHRPNVA